MKILYFSLGYSTHDHRFLKGMSDHAHEVFFVQLEGNQRQVEDRPIPVNVTLIKWAGGREPFHWRDLPRLTFDFRRLTKEIKPDLIHAGPIQNCALIAVLSGFRPVLTMSWGFDLMDDVHKGKIWEWATRYTLKRSTFFTSDANVTRDKAVAYGMNPDKTVVFPWGIDLQEFKPRKAPKSASKTPARKSKTLAPGASAGVVNQKSFTLFCNRAWESRYGVDVIARAFVKVAQQNDDVSLILLGGGSQAHNIRDILQRGGALERVSFGGQVSQTDLPRWYHMADIYISPSHVDGSSVSLMEALACGLPCLVSDIPANQEWVEDGINGWLFRDGDVDDLVEKILSALKKRRSFKKISEAAHKTAEQKADWSKNFGKLLDAYDKVIKRK